jgi:serine/threonine-protein kinase
MSSPPSVRIARAGERFGKYKIVAPLARGRLGTVVYEAVHTEYGWRVALKVLTTPSERALIRFRREAEYAARLRHQNIVALYDFGELVGGLYLAFEFVEGVNLFRYIRRKGRLQPEEARRIAIQACLALHHAHRQGIIHRDVKPSNFLVTRKSGRLLIKLSDLGLSLAEDETRRVTVLGATVGTPSYIAPEQVTDSHSADERSDLYSLGCTLYHMLAGHPPFTEGGEREKLLQQMCDQPPDILARNPGLPVAMAAMLKRLLAKAPERRYQSAIALLKDLVELDGSPWSAFEQLLNSRAGAPAEPDA